MKKAVIFDLDGLLIDSEVISHRLYDELLHRYGKSVTVAEYARDYSGKTGVANMTNVIARYNLPITVEEGCVFVLGDNRPNSADSRRDYVGQIREKDVKGELLFRLGNLSGLEKDIRRLQFKARRMFSGQF